MRSLSFALLITLFAFAGEPPLEPKIPHATLVREDLFAGILANDMQRFERGVKTVDRLLAERPKDKPSLLAWKGLTNILRAVKASEKGDDIEFQMKYRDALLNFADASDDGPQDPGVAAVIGGTYAIYGDRLPEKYRKGAWSMAYRNYQKLWKMQASAVEKLPLHIKGELLSGLALTAQRTGQLQESAQFVDRIIASMPGTPYEAAARKWKQDPASAARVKIACLSCHDIGRLEQVKRRG